MSNYPFGWGFSGNCGCDCSTTVASVPTCPYPDPGIASSPRYVATFDYRFQVGRLQSLGVNSFLIQRIDGSGNPVIEFSRSPQITPEDYNLALGQKFDNLLASLGSVGFRSLVPSGLSATAYLVANTDGTWALASAPTTTVPDPLTLTTLNAGSVNTTSLSATGNGITFSGLSTGTISKEIGLNSSNQLVIGNTAVSGAAQYYESNSLTSVSTPNSTVVVNQPVVIGNEIYDPNSLAHVQDTQTIVVDVPGQYSVRWGGTFAARGSSLFKPSLYLAYNSIGNVVSHGYGNNGGQNTNSAYNSGGEWLQDLSAGDKLYIICGGSPNTAAGNSGLSNVGMIIERLR